MKRALYIAVLAVFSTAALAAGETPTNIDSAKLTNDFSKGAPVLPGIPQAGVQAPKYSMIVPCTLEAGKAECIDVSWLPIVGPVEYVLMPYKKAEPVVKEVPVTVIKEVPAKKIKE